MTVRYGACNGRSESWAERLVEEPVQSNEKLRPRGICEVSAIRRRGNAPRVEVKELRGEIAPRQARMRTQAALDAFATEPGLVPLQRVHEEERRLARSVARAERPTHLDEDVQPPRPAEQVRRGEVHLVPPHEVGDDDGRGARDADAAVDEHLAAGVLGLLDELARVVERVADRVDAVVRDAAQIEHLHRPEPLLEPERVGRHPRLERRRDRARAGGRARRRRHLRRGNERRLADRNDVGDAELLEHERIRWAVSTVERIRNAQAWFMLPR